MKQRYLVCSDVHDDIEAFNRFVDYAQAKEVDRVLILGDLGLRPYTKQHLDDLIRSKDIQSFLGAKELHSKTKLEEFRLSLESSGIGYLIIPGNYDSPKEFEEVFGENNLHKKTTTLGEASVIGYGGADANPPHIDLLHRVGAMEEFDHNTLYELLKKEKADICLIHNPPYRLCDDMYNGHNVGTKATIQHILEDAPRLVLSGHIHEAGPLGNNLRGVKGVAGFKNPETGEITLVLNPGNLGRFELIDPLNLSPVRKFDYGTFLEVEVEADGIPKKVTTYSLDEKPQKIGQVRKLIEYGI